MKPMLPLNISVSKLERFEDMLAERWGLDQNKFWLYLQGKEEKTFVKDFGSAFHSFMEAPEKYPARPCIIDNYTIPNECIEMGLRINQSLPTPNAREVWVNKEIEVMGVICNVRGKVDCLCPGIIHDFKTTRSRPSYEAYMDKSQHLWYMFMADVPQFMYDVFFIQDKKENDIRITHEEFPFDWDPNFETRLMNSLKGFVDFIRIHGMIEDWNELVKQGKSIV